jgi:hypothetical protein
MKDIRDIVSIKKHTGRPRRLPFVDQAAAMLEGRQAGCYRGGAAVRPHHARRQ